MPISIISLPCAIVALQVRSLPHPPRLPPPPPTPACGGPIPKPRRQLCARHVRTACHDVCVHTCGTWVGQMKIKWPGTLLLPAPAPGCAACQSLINLPLQEDQFLSAWLVARMHMRIKNKSHSCNVHLSNLIEKETPQEQLTPAHMRARTKMCGMR